MTLGSLGRAGWTTGLEVRVCFTEEVMSEPLRHTVVTELLRLSKEGMWWLGLGERVPLCVSPALLPACRHAKLTGPQRSQEGLPRLLSQFPGEDCGETPPSCPAPVPVSTCGGAWILPSVLPQTLPTKASGGTSATSLLSPLSRFYGCRSLPVSLLNLVRRGVWG